MSGQDTALKDLSSIERLVVGTTLNFAYNLFSSQIEHIEHHDENLSEMLKNNEEAQKDFILLQNFKNISNNLVEIIGETFNDIPDNEREYLIQPAFKIEMFYKSLFDTLSCGNEEE